MYDRGGADGAGRKKGNANYEIDGDDVIFQGYGNVKGKNVSTVKGRTYVDNSSNKKTTSTPSTTSSGSSGSSGGTSGGGGTYYEPEEATYSQPQVDWAAYYAELERQRIEEERRRREELERRANEAYERNMQRISSAYGSAADSLSGNYNSTSERLGAARDKSLSDVNTDAEKSLREAYINNMLSKKNLNQRLSALGYNGGATETTMAQLANNYGNSRTGINETLNSNINDLNMSYGDNLAAALESYNNAKANLDLQKMQLEVQAENARNNTLDSTISADFNIDNAYLSALQAAIQNQNNYQYNPSAATNDYVAGTALQAQSATDSSNYAKALQQAMLEATQGNPTNIVQMANNNPQTLAQMLRQLGYKIS